MTALEPGILDRICSDKRVGLAASISEKSFIKLTSGKNFTTASEFFLKKSDNMNFGVGSSLQNAFPSPSTPGGNDAGTDSHDGGHQHGVGKHKCQCKHHQQSHDHVEKKEQNPSFVQAKRVFKYGNANF